MSVLKEIIDAYSVEKVSETSPQNIEITDLKDSLGTKGHVLVVRGDKAYADKLGRMRHLANPKFWLYENLIKSPRIQELLKRFPKNALFDGVGFSALEALGFHAKALGRKAVVVMAHELLPDPEVFQRYDIEVINADKPAEEGYVKKQAEVLSKRKDLIPLHQALYGAQALAPIGNKVVSRLEELCIVPDATLWCIASGSNLYGIGRKIKQRFPETQTMVVEPETNTTIDASLDLKNSEQVRTFSREKLRHYSLNGWDKHHSGIFPLHVSGANRYLLLLWEATGDTGFDEVSHIPTAEVLGTQKRLKDVDADYDWTKSTALTLSPAIRLAKQGQNVLVMAYGRDRVNRFRDLVVNGSS